MANCSVIELRNAPKSLLEPLVCALTVAGSDSSGGAGIEADLKTFCAHGVYGLDSITALTSQNTQRVDAVSKTSKELILSIINLNLDDFLRGYPEGEAPLKAIKTGMLTLDAVEALTDVLPELLAHDVKLVIDPVISATSGSKLSDDLQLQECIEYLIKKHATLVTPNYDEARILFGMLSGSPDLVPLVDSVESYKSFAVELQKLLQCKALFLKGGHIPWDKARGIPRGTAETGGAYTVLDILYEAETDTMTLFDSSFIETDDTHGSGCTIASAITANLAKGRTLVEAVTLATDYIHLCMSSMPRKLGHGNGPLNHCVRPETSLEIARNKHREFSSQDIALASKDLYSFLINHESIRESWKEYTHHEFVRRLARDELPFDQFLYYLKQDFHYLLNYAQVTAIGASVAHNYTQIQIDSQLIGNIMQEVERHKLKLRTKFDIDFDGPNASEELAPGKPCLDYCNYLFQVARSGDYLAIKTALAPCLHGYYEAGHYGQAVRTEFLQLGAALPKTTLAAEESAMYGKWLEDYCSDWFTEADRDGKRALQSIIEEKPLTSEKLCLLLNIFRRVVQLEIDFWNVVLEI